MSTTHRELLEIFDDDEWCTGVAQTVSDSSWDDVLFVDEYGESHSGAIWTDSSATITFEIFKSDSTEKGLVSGWANVAVNADGTIPLDWQGDVIAPDTLEDAAIEFMLDYRDSGVRHMGDSTGVVVESIVLTKDKQVAIGIPEGIVPEGWFITVKLFDEEVIEKVKNGEFKMFSIQGCGERVAI